MIIGGDFAPGMAFGSGDVEDFPFCFVVTEQEGHHASDVSRPGNSGTPGHHFAREQERPLLDSSWDDGRGLKRTYLKACLRKGHCRAYDRPVIIRRILEHPFFTPFGQGIFVSLQIFLVGAHVYEKRRVFRKGLHIGVGISTIRRKVHIMTRLGSYLIDLLLEGLRRPDHEVDDTII